MDARSSRLRSFTAHRRRSQTVNPTAAESCATQQEAASFLARYARLSRTSDETEEQATQRARRDLPSIARLVPPE